MISKLYIPSYPLNQFIESFYYYTGFKPEHSFERFLPDGNVQLIFDFTDYPKYIYDNETLKEIQSCRNVWFSGFTPTEYLKNKGVFLNYIPVK